MKQKLLNSFTWRGTLLVALLSCAFSAWGQTTTKDIPFTALSAGLGAVEGISWTTNGTSNITDSETSFTVTSSSITGKVIKVVVNGWTNNKGTVSVKIGNTTIGPKKLQKNSASDLEFSFSETVNNGDIVVNFIHDSKNLHLVSVTVTYEVPTNSSITISKDCYGLDGDGNVMKFGTYSNTCQFVLPDGVTASKIKVENGKLELTTLSGIIPANTGNTGILLSAPRNVDGSPTDFSGNVDFRLATATADVSGNMLQPSSAMPEEPADDTKYYCLRMDGTDIGFYYGADDGGVFTMPANRAFLAVTATTATTPTDPEANVQSFSFSDMVNGINAVETEKAESKVIYNLAGQRVSKMQRGIYVVNGKKMLVK